MNRVIGAVLVVAGVLYPFAVYFGHLSPRQFGVLLGALWLARLAGGKRQLPAALVALAFCAVLIALGDPRLLRWYPVMISAGLLAVFGLSLHRGMPIVERLARLTDPQLPPRAVRYTRHVTQAWAVFFAANGFAAAVLALWAPLTWWALYTGLIAYVLMGVLFVSEWLVRQRVRAPA